MSSFLKRIDEYKAPIMEPKPEDDVTVTGKPGVTGKSPRGPGIMAKAASGLQKVKKAADTIKTVGTGEWSIDNLLDGIVKIGMDRQSGKLTMFGKPGHNLVMLGKGYVDTIKARPSENKKEIVDDEKEADVPDDVASSTDTPEEQNESFLDIVNGLITEVTKEEAKKIRDKAAELDIPLETGSGKKIPPSRLIGKINRKIKELKQDEKQKKLELTDDEKVENAAIDAKDAKEEPKEDPKEKPKTTPKTAFKPIGSSRSAVAELKDTLPEILDPKKYDIDRIAVHVSKGLNRILGLIDKTYGKEGTALKDGEEGLDFTYKGAMKTEPGKKVLGVQVTKDKTTGAAGRIATEDKPDTVKEADENEPEKEYIVGQQLVDTMGKDGAEKFLQNVKPIYPGKEITFTEKPKDDPEEKPEDKPEDDPDEEPKEEIKQDILTDSTKFKLVNGKDYGENRQYTLKAEEYEVAQYLGDKGVQFITYLQKPKPRMLAGAKGGQVGSNMELSSSSGGQLIAYDKDSEPISDLNIEAPFEWNSNEKAYSLSRGNTVKLGPDAAKGEMGFPADSTQIYFSDPNRKFIVLAQNAAAADEALAGGEKLFLGDEFRPGFDKSQFKKYAIVRTDEEGDFVVNIRQPLPLSPGDAKAMQKFKSSVAASIRAGGTGAGVGKGAEQTAKDKTKGKQNKPFQQKVKPDVQAGQGVITDPKTGKPITGETLPSQNEEEKIVSKYLEKIEEYL